MAEEKQDISNDVEIYKKTIISVKYHSKSNTWELNFGDGTIAGTPNLIKYFETHPNVSLHSSLFDFYQEYLKVTVEYEQKVNEEKKITKEQDEIIKQEKEAIRNFTDQNESYRLVKSNEMYGDLVDYNYILVNKKGQEVVKVYKNIDTKVMSKEELINFYINLGNKTSSYFKEEVFSEEDEELFPYILARSKNKYYVFPRGADIKEMSVEAFLASNWELGIREREEIIDFEIEEKRSKQISSSTWDMYQYTKIPLVGPDGEVVKIEKEIQKGNTGNFVKVKVPLTIYTKNRSHKQLLPESEKHSRAVERDMKSVVNKMLKEIQLGKLYEQTKNEAIRQANELASKIESSIKMSSSRRGLKNKGNVLKAKNASSVNLLEQRVSNGVQLIVKNYLGARFDKPGQYLEETADVYIIQNKTLVSLGKKAMASLKKQGKDVSKSNLDNQIKIEEQKYRKSNKKNLIPTLLYEIKQPSPSVAKRYVLEKRYGCVYAAIKFFLYVINTPLDEEYTGKRVIPAHEEVRVKKLRVYDKSGKIRKADEIAKEAVYVTTVPEKTVTYKHIPDNESVRGDWVLSFRGKNIKAYTTTPNEESLGVPYDYVLDESYFTMPNKKEGVFTVEDALSMEKNIRRLADKLEEITADYEPPSVKGKSVFSSETFNSIMMNDNPRWLWLENGGLIPKGDKPKQGARYSHGATSQGFSYQAPRGFIRRTDAMLEPLMVTKLGKGKRASTLINRFVSDYRSGKSDFTKYFERYLKNTWVEVSKVSKTDNLRIPSKNIKQAR